MVKKQKPKKKKHFQATYGVEDGTDSNPSHVGKASALTSAPVFLLNFTNTQPRSQDLSSPHLLGWGGGDKRFREQDCQLL